jgi:hypothetical protein
MKCVDRHWTASVVPTLVEAEYRVWLIGSATPLLLCAAHANERDDAGQVGKAHRLVSGTK